MQDDNESIKNKTKKEQEEEGERKRVKNENNCRNFSSVLHPSFGTEQSRWDDHKLLYKLRGSSNCCLPASQYNDIRHPKQLSSRATTSAQKRQLTEQGRAEEQSY
jgi:hypothetical protein